MQRELERTDNFAKKFSGECTLMDTADISDDSTKIGAECNIDENSERVDVEGTVETEFTGTENFERSENCDGHESERFKGFGNSGAGIMKFTIGDDSEGRHRAHFS